MDDKINAIKNDVKDQPMVSICCQTFNHKNYIAEALDSFLMQNVNFSIEILLRDDASTDGTAEICKDYANRFPNIINLLAYEENQFQKGIRPFRDNVKRAKGKYIAMCEGDDYWIDPLKLQKQIGFLENNQDYIATSHHRYVLENEIFTKEECNNNVFTQCLVFRNILEKDDYYHIGTVFNTDSFLKLILEVRGKIKYFDFYGAVYRYSNFGVYSSLDKVEKYKKSLDSLTKMKIYVGRLEKNYKNTKLLSQYTNDINAIVVFNCFFDKKILTKDRIPYFFQNYSPNNFLRTMKDVLKLVLSFTPLSIRKITKNIIKLPENNTMFS